ncbi:MAG: hypothetical protein IT245_00965 [Bacteroidia bacterium]|nr:hypothetical protein [Bacteroidia bacterium]
MIKREDSIAYRVKPGFLANEFNAIGDNTLFIEKFELAVVSKLSKLLSI